MFSFWRKSPIRSVPCAARFPFPTKFSPRIESFQDVHCAIDYDLANLSMVQVNGGYVAIDAGTHPETTRTVAAEFTRRAGGKIQALIYTHSHPDHICGAAGYELDEVPVWGHRKFADDFSDAQLLPNAYFTRGSKQTGTMLPEEMVLSNGIGPALRPTEGALPPVYFPTHFVDQTQEIDVGGRTLVLRWSPGETNDHVSVWLPEHRTLMVGDNLYKAFPNLYTLRGMSPRPVRRWIESLDEMRRLQPRPELLILGHTAPIQGADAVYSLLTDYRDAIAFVHDSVIRGINAGKSPHQLAREIQLPPHLRDHPFLQEHYGTLSGSIRGIYAGYMGWFDGDASNADPPTDQELAAWIVEELGGHGELLARIRRAQQQNNLPKALWLSRMLQAHSPSARDSREAKADILQQLAEESTNPLVRNWQLSEAALLRGTARYPAKPKLNGATIAHTPVVQLLSLLPSRLNPKNSARLTMSLGFDLTDSGQQFTFFIRRGVGELAAGLWGPPDLTVRATERNMKRLFLAGDVPPTRLEFWQNLEFVVPHAGILTSVDRLRKLALLNRLFLRP